MGAVLTRLPVCEQMGVRSGVRGQPPRDTLTPVQHSRPRVRPTQRKEEASEEALLTLFCKACIEEV